MDPLLAPAEADITHDAILDGRLRLAQPRRGHRFGHDAVLLAAAVPAEPGDRVIDLGAGVGAAGLALASRVALGFLTLVEIDPTLARLAADNAKANGFDNRTRVITADARLRGRARETAGLTLGAVDRVMTNPPFHDAGRHRASPDRARKLAHADDGDLLADFLRTAAAIVRPGGTVTVIHRADDPAALLEAFKGRFGQVTIRAIHPRPEAAAIRLIATGTKGSRAPVAILPSLVLTQEDGRMTAEAEAILRGGRGM